MEVPKGKRVYTRARKYKAGDKLPDHIIIPEDKTTSVSEEKKDKEKNKK